MNVTTEQWILSIAGSGGVSSAITALLSWMRSRGKDKMIALGAVEGAARDLVRLALASADQQLKTARQEVAGLRKDLGYVSDQLDVVRHELDATKAQHIHCQEDLSRLREEFSSYASANEVPAYDRLLRPAESKKKR